jgi:hypothetical protein
MNEQCYKEYKTSANDYLGYGNEWSKAYEPADKCPRLQTCTMRQIPRSSKRAAKGENKPIERCETQSLLEVTDPGRGHLRLHQIPQATLSEHQIADGRGERQEDIYAAQERLLFFGQRHEMGIELLPTGHLPPRRTASARLRARRAGGRVAGRFHAWRHAVRDRRASGRS